MNTLKTNPSGIDKAIEMLQKPLYKGMKQLNPEIKGFGRVFKNKREKGFVLETYLGDNEYRDVLGGEDSRFYFYLHNDLKGDADITAKVDVIFMVKLTDFFEGPERRDEEFRQEAARIIQKSRFKLQGIVIGMEYIQKLLSGLFEQTNINFSDMHPYHAVTFQTEVYYNLKNC